MYYVQRGSWVNHLSQICSHFTLKVQGLILLTQSTPVLNSLCRQRLYSMSTHSGGEPVLLAASFFVLCPPIHIWGIDQNSPHSLPSSWFWCHGQGWVNHNHVWWDVSCNVPSLHLQCSGCVCVCVCESVLYLISINHFVFIICDLTLIMLCG